MDTPQEKTVENQSPLHALRAYQAANEPVEKKWVFSLDGHGWAVAVSTQR
jgi:hypothetical protein